MERGVFGVELPRMIRLRRILFGEYRGLLPLAPALAVAPVGLALMLWVRLTPDTTRTVNADATHDAMSRRRQAAIVATTIAVYFILFNAGYAYWEGGWSYGPRHASPAIPFLCIGLAFLWTALPAFGRWALALLSAYGAAMTLIAVTTMPLPPANVRRPVQELLLPAFLDGDLALNTQTFASGRVDADFRAHREPRAAFNLGMKMGLGTGHASLVPLAIVWLACGYPLIVARGRRRTAPSATTATERSLGSRGPS
jgi:hypothetical protein